MAHVGEEKAFGALGVFGELGVFFYQFFQHFGSCAQTSDQETEDK